MTDNTAIWDALGKTDPNHTKGFSRAGGFKGTSTKPIWVYRRLTEHFGPVGIGWGHGKPEFQVVPGGNDETLVYCIVECWHTNRANTFYGVGGDKAVAKNKNGQFSDDEAFKKAFTDAVMNAFKSVGVAADIHMGLFDDDKYVTRMRKEFSEQDLPTGPINDATRDWIASKIEGRQIPVGELCKAFEVTSLKALTYEQIEDVKNWIRDYQKEAA